MSILVVEDSIPATIAIKGMLNKIGFDVDVAEDGYKAFQMATNDNEYQLIFMDIGLPVLTGIEATSKIRSQNINIPIVALTANLNSHSQEILRSTGFNGGYQKPLSFSILAEVVSKFHLIPRFHHKLLLDSLPVIESLESVCSRLGYPEATLLEVRTLFVGGIDNTLQSIEKAFKDEDWADLESEMLKFYGGCLYLGIPRLTLTADWLYRTLYKKNHLIDDIEKFYSLFMAEMTFYPDVFTKISH